MTKIELLEKIRTFTELMKEISHDINDIYNYQHEDEYHDLLIQMLEALDEAQRIVKKAFAKELNRGIKENE